VESINETQARAGQALEEEHQRALAAEAAKTQELAGTLETEKNKHQATAHKLLDTRAKVREHEATIAELKASIEALNARVADNDRAMQAQAEAHSLALESEQMMAQQFEKELEVEKARSADIDRSFAALHRELLTVVDQRDDAVRRADSERAERQRIEKSMYSKG
jgi:hypothetical protein